MTDPQPDSYDDRGLPPTTADPTMRVARPPIPGRAVRAEMEAGSLATPPIHHDEPTVTLAHVSRDPRRTLEFGTPAPVKVTVGPRPRPRRRYRTWPWIVAVVFALIVLGTVLLVMLMRGATIDANTDLIGSGPSPTLVSDPGAEQLPGRVGVGRDPVGDGQPVGDVDGEVAAVGTDGAE